MMTPVLLTEPKLLMDGRSGAEPGTSTITVSPALLTATSSALSPVLVLVVPLCDAPGPPAITEVTPEVWLEPEDELPEEVVVGGA